MANETVEVDIRCVERVFYNQRVQMTKAQYDDLMLQTDCDLEDPLRSVLVDYLNMKDVCDSLGFEDIEIDLAAQ